MVPPGKDVWAPPPEQVYSKEAVNRAGELLRQFFHTPREAGKDILDGWDGEAVVEAMFAVTATTPRSAGE